MTVSLNVDEIKAIIAEYFSVSEDDVRIGTIEIKKNMRIDHEPSAAIKNCDIRDLNIVKKWDFHWRRKYEW